MRQNINTDIMGKLVLVSIPILSYVMYFRYHYDPALQYRYVAQDYKPGLINLIEGDS